MGGLLLPSTVLVEACWLINVRMGAEPHAVFLKRIAADISDEKLTLVELVSDDVARMAELAHTYRDARLDPADLSVIALAERLNVTEVATLDH